jgi:hypothetical protein
VVSGPLATAAAAGLAGPSSTTAACSGPVTSGRASVAVSARGTVGTRPLPSWASAGADTPGASADSLASCQGAAALAFSKRISMRPDPMPIHGTSAPSAAVARGDRWPPAVVVATSATNHCG